MLSLLGYFRNPSRVQSILRGVYDRASAPLAEIATKELGCPVVTLPLYEVMDSRDSNDYVQKVEPSAAGGAKIAAAVVDLAAKYLAK